MKNSQWIVNCEGHVVVCRTPGELRWILGLPDKGQVDRFTFLEVRSLARFGSVEIVERTVPDILRGLGTAGTQSRRMPKRLFPEPQYHGTGGEQ